LPAEESLFRSEREGQAAADAGSSVGSAVERRPARCCHISPTYSQDAIGGRIAATRTPPLHLCSTAAVTFGEFSIKLVISQMMQNNTKVFHMLCFILGINEDIINEYHYELVQFIHED
jgi:hypothetical protein